MTGNQSDLTTGERLRLLRGRRHLSLRQVAEETEIPFTTLSRWERDGPPSGRSLRRLAGFYGVSADYLLGLLPERIEVIDWSRPYLRGNVEHVEDTS